MRKRELLDERRSNTALGCKQNLKKKFDKFVWEWLHAIIDIMYRNVGVVYKVPEIEGDLDKNQSSTVKAKSS